jgi:hypothetical protein
LGNLKFLPDDLEFMLVEKRAASSNNAQQGEKGNETKGLDVVIVTKYPRDAVVEDPHNKQEEAAANQSDIR